MEKSQIDNIKIDKNDLNSSDNVKDLNDEIIKILENKDDLHYKTFNNKRKKYKLNDNDIKKKILKNVDKKAYKIKFNEFNSYVDNFLNFPTDKKFISIFSPQNASIINTKEVSKKLENYLKDRLCAAFIMNADIDINDYNYEDELQLNTELLHCTYDDYQNNSCNIINFFVNNKIIESFYLPEVINKLIKYHHITNKTNKYRDIVQKTISERLFPKIYFKLYDSIHKELKEMFIKLVIKKRKKIDEFDEQIVIEYLNRENEFLEEFGSPSQFKNNQLNYDNILESDDTIYEKYLV